MRAQTPIGLVIGFLFLLALGKPLFPQDGFHWLGRMLEVDTSEKTQVNLARDILFLCDPSLKGRDAPGWEANRVAEFIAQRFADLGLKPLFGDSYFQKVELISASIDTLHSFQAFFIIAQDTFPLKWREDFLLFPKVPISYEIEATVVDCGQGIYLPQAGRDDFTADVEGRAVLVRWSGEREEKEFGLRATTPFKAARASDKKAKILLVLYPDTLPDISQQKELSDKLKELTRPLTGLPHDKADLPVLYLSPKAGKRLTDKRSEEAKVYLKVSFPTIQRVFSYNVGAYVGEGSRPVLITAHYDHIGVSADGEIYYGADDNASGVALLLELARSWKEGAGSSIGYPLWFVAFTCEEDGLLGAHYFLNHPPTSSDSIKAVINMDEVGRDGWANMRDVEKGIPPSPNYLAAYYHYPFTNWGGLLKRWNQELSPLLEVDIRPIASFRHFGDSAPFAEQRIPVLHLFSGFHRDYHQPTDTPDKLNFRKMAYIKEGLRLLILDLLQDTSVWQWDPNASPPPPTHIY